jgi:hypothetical protein
MLRIVFIVMQGVGSPVIPAMEILQLPAGFVMGIKK